MSRTYLERKHLTELYQKKQIEKLGPFKDYNRRPDQTFMWTLMGYDQFSNTNWKISDYPSADKIGFFRNHNYRFCGCRECRIVTRANKKNPSRWNSKNYKKESIRKQEIKEMKQEVIDFTTLL